MEIIITKYQHSKPIPKLSVVSIIQQDMDEWWSSKQGVRIVMKNIHYNQSFILRIMGGFSLRLLGIGISVSSHYLLMIG